MTSSSELYRDLYDKLTALLAEEGIPGETAQTVVMKTVEWVRRDFGGMTMYFPKVRVESLAKRDMVICKRFNGQNRHQLCREYQISEQRLYQILAARRKVKG